MVAETTYSNFFQKFPTTMSRFHSIVENSIVSLIMKVFWCGELGAACPRPPLKFQGKDVCTKDAQTIAGKNCRKSEVESSPQNVTSWLLYEERTHKRYFCVYKPAQTLLTSENTISKRSGLEKWDSLVDSCYWVARVACEWMLLTSVTTEARSVNSVSVFIRFFFLFTYLLPLQSSWIFPPIFGIKQSMFHNILTSPPKYLQSETDVWVLDYAWTLTRWRD